MKTNPEVIQFLNALMSNMDIGIISYNNEGLITLINNKAIEYLGITASNKDLVDTEILMHFDIPDLHDNIELGISKSRKNFHLSNVFYNERYLLIDGKKLLGGMLLTITDITESVLAKDDATQSLLLGQEMERRRLAKEIHDGVGPNMSTLKLQIDSIIRKATSEEIISSLEEINISISEIATEIRQISHDLMPSSLIDFGVVTALSNFSKRISASSDLEVHYQSNIIDGQLSKEHELNIYRIVQELINNALKYSKCKSIEISLRQDNDEINILVEDDGIGMDTTLHSEGVGLNNIITRVESLQGEIDIDSQIGSGVSVYIALPIIY